MVRKRLDRIYKRLMVLFLIDKMDACRVSIIILYFFKRKDF